MPNRQTSGSVSHATYVKIYMASTLMQCLTRSLKPPSSRGVVARSAVLPEDIFLEIATYLSIPDLFNLSLTVSHRAPNLSNGLILIPTDSHTPLIYIFLARSMHL